MKSNIVNFVQADNENKKELEASPWPILYSAVQNDTILHETPMAIEKHSLKGHQVNCLVIMFGDTVKGLIPQQEAAAGKKNTINQLRNLLGQKIAFKIMKHGLDRENNLVLLSRRQALDEMREKVLDNLNVGDIRQCVVRRVLPNHAVVDIGGVEATLPDNEMAYGWIGDTRDFVQEGESFDIKVINIDDKTNVTVSRKELLTNPWEYVPNKYLLYSEYVGTVTGKTEYGFFCNLEPGVDALSTLPKFKIDSIQKGDKVLIRIQRIQPKEQWIKAKFVSVVQKANN